MSLLAAPPSPELVDACGDAPSSACRWVYEQTHSAGVAKAADFLLARPLQILLILVVAIVANAIVRRAIVRFSSRLVSASESRSAARVRDKAPAVLARASVPSKRAKARAETVTSVLRGLATFLIFGIAALYIVAALGLNLGPLLAGAGVAGIAIGFGAQTLVKDFIAGLFILMEDQYGVGDVVDLGEASGSVEAVSLRATRVRDVEGTLWHVPNGEIRRVGNKSQQWARAVVDITVAYGSDLDAAQRLIEEAGAAVSDDPQLSALVLEPPEVWGVEHVGPDGVTIRVVVKTQPGSQWSVMRALRAVAAERLSSAGIAMPLTQRAVVTPPTQPD